MLTKETAEHIAHEWFNAFNEHNLDKIMEHYAEDIAFHSPFIVKLMNDPQGKIVGQENLRIYFQKALTNYPDLLFELYHIVPSVNSIAIVYKSVNDLFAVETMILNKDQKIQEVYAHYKPME